MNPEITSGCGSATPRSRIPTATDPLRALEHPPAGEVDVFANDTAFLELRGRVAARAAAAFPPGRAAAGPGPMTSTGSPVHRCPDPVTVPAARRDRDAPLSSVHLWALLVVSACSGVEGAGAGWPGADTAPLVVIPAVALFALGLVTLIRPS